MKFRTLRADEIECRVSTVSAKGCSLLLYKDARADMTLLDETVGSENWQRNHELVNGNLFCNVGIKVDGEWVWKQDVGTESYTEKEKGQASDSFKRACVNWGIGRELYTAPFIWIPAADANLTDGKNGQKTTYERFGVKAIAYDESRNISGLVIENVKTHKAVYKYGECGAKKNTTPTPAEPANGAHSASQRDERVEEASAKARVMAYINRHSMSKEDIDKLCRCYRISSVQEMTLAMCKHYINAVERKGGSIDE